MLPRFELLRAAGAMRQISWLPRGPKGASGGRMLHISHV